MKPFNVFIILFLIVIGAGLVFFKDGFSTKPSNSEILMDIANYRNYSDQNLAFSKKTGRSVLFFAATSWCVTCIALDKEIKERRNSLPSDITILKVDYDHNKEMKRKWGVIIQHTLIVLDKNGQEVKRWVGGNFDLLLSELSNS